jgi:UDP-2,3-diacylglucosamine pyrophosphatase LpxH
VSGIRYVCISDLHLGEEESLLTGLNEQTSEIDCLKKPPVMELLAECLKEITGGQADKKPSLILCGDILELALAGTHEAAMVFERLMELLMPAGEELFDRVLYLPGNHDHHLWELARETQYVNHVFREGRGKELPEPWHSTRLLRAVRSGGVTSYFLSRLVDSSGLIGDFPVEVAYPNLGIVSGDANRCVIFHHGHFIEPVYMMMSRIRNLLVPEHPIPRRVNELEAENYAWIDFLWSMIGRSGSVGETVETIHDKMHFPDNLRVFLHDFAGKLAGRFGMKGPADLLERKVLERAADFLVEGIAGMEKFIEGESLGKRSRRGLIDYLSGPVMNQLKDEMVSVPEDVTFVFGHTHKPLCYAVDVPGYPKPVRLHNAGCWVVESIAARPARGGSVVVVDEQLNTASVRIYSEEGGGPTIDGDTELAASLREMIDPAKRLWSDFRGMSLEQAEIRRSRLKARIGAKL